MPNNAYQSLPLLASDYIACTFPYFSRGSGLPSYEDWIEVFRKSIPTFHAHALTDESVDEEDRQVAADVFAATFSAALDTLFKHGSRPRNCADLCDMREKCLRAAGCGDIFLGVKQKENAAALQVLPSVLQELDTHSSVDDRLEMVLRGVFAGNIFDLGAASSAEKFKEGGAGAQSFVNTRNTLLPRPWAVDNLDQAVQRLKQVEGQRVFMFVDNSGSDVILGMLPLAREAVRLGARQVVLAANEYPSINDITAAELGPLLEAAAAIDPVVLGPAVSSQRLVVQSSGSDLPVIDLKRVCKRMCDDILEHGCDLLVLEGMGRAIETNLHAVFQCDSLKLGMVKHPEVATCLGGRLYDCVCCFTPGSQQQQQQQQPPVKLSTLQ